MTRKENFNQVPWPNTKKQEYKIVIVDHSPIGQTFEFGKSISIAGKSILNFIQLSCLVAKYYEIWKI